MQPLPIVNRVRNDAVGPWSNSLARSTLPRRGQANAARPSPAGGSGGFDVAFPVPRGRRGRVRASGHVAVRRPTRVLMRNRRTPNPRVRQLLPLNFSVASMEPGVERSQAEGHLRTAGIQQPDESPGSIRCNRTAVRHGHHDELTGHCQRRSCPCQGARRGKSDPGRAVRLQDGGRHLRAALVNEEKAYRTSANCRRRSRVLESRPTRRHRGGQPVRRSIAGDAVREVRLTGVEPESGCGLSR